MSIKHKLTLAFVVMLSLLVILGGINLKINKETILKEELYLFSYNKTVLLTTLKGGIGGAIKEAIDVYFLGEGELSEYERKKQTVKNSLVELKKLKVNEGRFLEKWKQYEGGDESYLENIEKHINFIFKSLDSLINSSELDREEKFEKIFGEVIENRFEHILAVQIDEIIREKGYLLEDILETEKSNSKLLERITYIAWGFSFFIFALVFYSINLFLIRPILSISKAAGKIGQGEYDIDIKIDSNDEVGLLSNSFQKMTNDLKSTETEHQKLINTIEVKNKELKRSNEELQQFAFIASHDLQEPLRKVITFGGLLVNRTKNLDETSRNYIDRMQNAVLRMQQFIEDLLEFSKATKGANNIEKVDLSQIVNKSVSALEVLVNDTKGKIIVDPLPSIDASPVLLAQLFQNLIGNALKFHRKGSEPIVSISSKSSENGDIQITVKDNGIGLDVKYYEKIFHPFQRLHGRNEFEGTGMGLAICRKIVDRHNGTITVNSILGEGSTFFINLPKDQIKV